MKERKENPSSLLKGRPIFKRHLYISSALFGVIIVIVSFTLFRLATGSLRDRIGAELMATTESLARLLREEIQNVNARVGTDGSREFQRVAEIETFMTGLLQQQDELLYIFVQDLKGEVLWKAIRRGLELEQNQFSRILISPRSSRAPQVEVTSLGNPSLNYLDLIEPIVLNDQPELIVHFGVDQRTLENRYSGLRASLLHRMLLGSAVVVGILSLALLYVLWLLKRAQVVEAEAHEADHLASLGTLAGGLAHEIRNPLSAINLNLQMIEEDLAGVKEESSDLGMLLKGTKEEIRRLDRLATNFLAYARPLDLETKDFDVAQLLDEIILLKQRECENSGIQLLKEPSNDSLKIKGDPDLLKQAVLNLVVNAEDSVMQNENGNRRIQLAMGRRANQVFIRVADNGPGVSTEDVSDLFKLFYSGKRGGTGLGLPIAQRIVESHGGRIEWRNLPERGAEFTIWI